MATAASVQDSKLNSRDARPSQLCPLFLIPRNYINYLNTYRLLSATISLFQKFCGGHYFLFTFMYLLRELLQFLLSLRTKLMEYIKFSTVQTDNAFPISHFSLSVALHETARSSLLSDFTR